MPAQCSGPRRTTLVLWSSALALSLPVLFVGLFNDDFIHRLALSGVWTGYQRSAFTLYDFLSGGRENAQLIDTGMLPWFADPALTIRFFRPLSSALLSFDVLAFGDNAALAHAHSLCWLALATLLAWKIQRALLPERAALFAAWLFALAGSHVYATAWLASRHVLISGALGLGAWYALIRWQHTQRHRCLALSVGLLVLGFLASEAVLPVVPFLLGQAWFGRRAGERARLPLLLFTLPTFAYLGAYGLAGFGTRNIGSYVSPFESPARFLLAVLERLPLMTCELFTSIPAVVSYGGPTQTHALQLLGCAATLLVLTPVWRGRRALGARGAALGWLPFALLAACVPLCGTILDGRVLLLPMVGSSALLGVLLARVLPATPSRLGRALGRAGLALLLLLHFGLSPLVRVGFALNYRGVGKLERSIPERAQLACSPQSRIVLLNGSDPTIGMYGGPIFFWTQGLIHGGFHVLSMAPNDLEVTRDGERAFVLATLGVRKAHFIEALYRPREHALAAGDRVELASMVVQVLDTSDAGPTRIRVELREGLDSPAYCLARWRPGNGGRLESLTLPEAGALRIPYERGLLGM